MYSITDKFISPAKNDFEIGINEIRILRYLTNSFYAVSSSLCFCNILQKLVFCTKKKYRSTFYSPNENVNYCNEICRNCMCSCLESAKTLFFENNLNISPVLETFHIFHNSVGTGKF